MPKPTISIIIPVYNVEKYLTQCLDSVKAQTFPDFEAICINDGATDGSLAILEQYAATDCRFRIISQPHLGPSEARNAGLRAATGKYIYFLDSDDSIHCQLLEIAYNLAEQHQAEVVCFDFAKNYQPKQAERREV